MHLAMELGHLKAAVEMMRKYDGKDASELLPKHLPQPIVFRPNVDYVRTILESQVNLTAVGQELKFVDQIDRGFRYFTYQDMVNGSWVPSEEAVEQHLQKFGKDYRHELTDESRAGRINLAEYYRQKAPSTDIFSLLHKEHNVTKQLFEKIKVASPAQGALFSELAEDLSLHMEGEEHLFYPRLRDTVEAKDETMEAYDEHNEAKGILKEINNIPFGNKEWMAKLDELRRSVEHHVDEEERRLFDKARRLIDKEESERMARTFQAERERNLKKTG
jgi:hemerythrin superfamily protein